MELIVALIIVISFITCVVFLMRKSSLTLKDAAHFRRVSVTIIIFTGVWVACFLPYIIVIILLMSGTENPIPSYVYFVSYVFLLVVNAAANPCVYLSRMPAYRVWVRSLMKRPVRGTTENTYVQCGGSRGGNTLGNR